MLNFPSCLKVVCCPQPILEIERWGVSWGQFFCHWQGVDQMVSWEVQNALPGFNGDGGWISFSLAFIGDVEINQRHYGSYCQIGKLHDVIFEEWLTNYSVQIIQVLILFVRAMFSSSVSVKLSLCAFRSGIWVLAGT